MARFRWDGKGLVIELDDVVVGAWESRALPERPLPSQGWVYPRRAVHQLPPAVEHLDFGSWEGPNSIDSPEIVDAIPVGREAVGHSNGGAYRHRH